MSLGVKLLLLELNPHPDRCNRDPRQGNQHPDPASNIAHQRAPTLALRYIVASVDVSTGEVLRLSGLAAANTPHRIAQRLDLRRGLRAAVGDDLLEHSDPLLKLMRARS